MLSDLIPTTHSPFLYNFLLCMFVCVWSSVCAEVRKSSAAWHYAPPSHVRLHPLCVSVGIVGMLRGVGKACGATVLPESALRGCSSASDAHTRPHAVHLIRCAAF